MSQPLVWFLALISTSEVGPLTGAFHVIPSLAPEPGLNAVESKNLNEHAQGRVAQRLSSGVKTGLD